jgi:hypothetical protein
MGVYCSCGGERTIRRQDNQKQKRGVPAFLGKIARKRSWVEVPTVPVCVAARGRMAGEGCVLEVSIRLDVSIMVMRECLPLLTNRLISFCEDEFVVNVNLFCIHAHNPGSTG